MSRRIRNHLVVAAAVCAACSGKSDGGTGVAGSIVVEPRAGALCLGDSLAFTARVLNASGDSVPGAIVRWSSSAPNAVAIDTATGMAHALEYGGALITATSGGVRSADPAAVEVPPNLIPEFVPDTVVLAPGDTMTLGVRLRRPSDGLVPAEVPRIAPLDSSVARLDTTGLVTAKTQGLQGFSLSACGFTGHGAARVFTPSDTLTGYGYLWLSGTAQIRASLPAKAVNFTLKNGGPAFQVVSSVGSATSPSQVFLYEYTAALTGTGTYRIDSLLSTEVSTAACAPPRPFAFYNAQSPLTALLSLGGGHTDVTGYAPKSGYVAVSGRSTLRVRGIANGNTAVLDTLQAIYTFSAPLVSAAGACP